jgi:hypothetical protein
MERSQSEEFFVTDEPCFKDFFPETNKKYKQLYQDLEAIEEYDWKSYLNLFDISPRKTKNYCKRKCYNQRFSPNKYNKQRNQYPEKRELEEFVRLMDSDPSKEKINCIWTIENRKEILGLDVEDVRRNIDLFLFNYPGRSLPKTYEELVAEILYIPRYSREGGYPQDEKDVIVLYKGRYGTLLVPITQEASCRYGKGTKWCTASTSPSQTNRFSYYNSMGPLYIWIDKTDDKKYQFHFENLEFRDMLDVSLPKPKILEFRNHPVLKELFVDGEKKLLESLEKEQDKISDKAFTYYYMYILDYDWPEMEKLLYRNPKIRKLFYESIGKNFNF